MHSRFLFAATRLQQGPDPIRESEAAGGMIVHVNMLRPWTTESKDISNNDTSNLVYTIYLTRLTL
jgi:hypothetical protein